MRIAALIVIAAALSVVIVRPSIAQIEPADTVFKNGNNYTVNEAQPKAEAIPVRYGRIVVVGSNVEVKKYEGKKVTKVVDLKGATIVPGMTDAHYHFSGVGFRELNLNLEGTIGLE